VDFSTPEMALAVRSYPQRGDWYSQHSIPVNLVKNENEAFSAKLSAEDLLRINTEVDKYMDKKILPYLQAKNLLHQEEHLVYYRNVILIRHVSYFLYARFLTWLVESSSFASQARIGVGEQNPAMKIDQSTGGIDLTSDKALQVKNDGSGQIQFHLNPTQLAQLQNAPSFVPVIISIQPMADLKGFLGLNEELAAVHSA
jgi:hypothetical protein